MHHIGLIATSAFLLGGLLIHHAIADIGTRAHAPLEVEILAVADYSSFDRWYQTTDSKLPHATRVNIAKQNLTTWIGTMIHSANLVYKGLEAHNLFVQLKLVDLRIMTTASASPWTETTKFKVNSTFMIDYRVVHPLFKVKSLELQKTIPHDHAMLLTRYTLTHGPNGTHFYAGNAFFAAECKPNSQSIIKDTDSMYTAQAIAHELGHSLGCEHDGEKNACADSAGYCMAAKLSTKSTNKWIFSSCSVTYIRNFITKLNREKNNCLARVDDNHANTELGKVSQKWVGEVFTPDQLCVAYLGKGSYFCRDKYQGNFTDLCRKMYCYSPARGSCSYTDAGDGVACAAGSWCVSGECVKDSRAPTVVDNRCVAGDQEGVVYEQQTCGEIVKAASYNCLQSHIKYKCCASCKHSRTHAVPVDRQCQQRFGDKSYMCRYSSMYRNATYSKLCRELLCTRPNNANYCNGMKAYDKTTCGNKMWCMNGQCVHNKQAPAVHDASCIPGDRVGVVHENQTCQEIVKNSPRKCLETNVKRLCCRSCEDVNVKAVSVDAQCSSKFGQGSTMCRNINTYKRNPDHPYSVICGGLYCSNTTVPSMCHWMRAFDMTPCGNKKWCKGGQCVHDENAPAILDEKCLLGDQTGVVNGQQTCQDIVNNSPSMCLQKKIKDLCCSSCKSVNVSTAPSVDTQCSAMFGKGSTMCRHSSIYNHNHYSVMCSNLYCHDTKTTSMCHSMAAYDMTPCGHKKWCMDGKCVQDNRAPDVSDNCPMGDHDNDPSVTYANLTCAEIAQQGNNWPCYSGYTARECCNTCATVRRDIKGCEYGDRLKGCVRSACGRYQPQALTQCCETCRASAIVG
ncbi:A disintegrin and metalloproteinase with thrombospondin motifs 20-like [Mercenaria mercenaria]|uniref:A disintegrin and metalloproteinase with thrombospondin motifs 20-like n=1 Tax=Mercenaria mercenaria TaxID=6596 RepID=UPI00234F28D8|nr:A disintegrin and metalloproteinase with thrombospondin motifs 20-like [Mercenaria mercenaria]